MKILWPQWFPVCWVAMIMAAICGGFLLSIWLTQPVCGVCGEWGKPINIDNVGGFETGITAHTGAIVISSNQALSGTSYSVPATVSLHIISGASLYSSSGSGTTVNFYGPVDAGPLAWINGAKNSTGVTAVWHPGAVMELYPEWWGAKNNAANTDGSTIQACFDSASASKTGSYRPVVRFQPNAEYRSSSPLTCKNNVHIIMDSPFYYTGAADEVALTIGVSGTANDNVRLKLWMERATQSNWKSDKNIGVRLINIQNSKVDVSRIGKFTVGLQVYGQGGSCLYNQFGLGVIDNCKYGLDLNSDTPTRCVNENVFIGGRFEVWATEVSPITRYGVAFRGAGYYHNNNVFVKPSFELGLKGIPIYVQYGQSNHFIQPRIEGNSTTAMLVLNNSEMNSIDTSYNYASGFAAISGISESGTYGGANIMRSLPWTYLRDDRRILVFDSGYLPEKATSSVLGSNTHTHVPGMFGQSSSGKTVTPTISGVTVTDTYITLNGNNHGYGIIVDTTKYKKYYAKIEMLSGATNGLIWIVCKDVNGNVLNTRGVGHPYVKPSYGSAFTHYNSYFGGAYVQANANSESAFEVGADVASMHVIYSCSNSRPNGRMTKVSLFSDGPATVRSGYQSAFEGSNMAWATPSGGPAKPGKVAYNFEPGPGVPVGWVCTQRLDTRVKARWNGTDSTGDITTTARLAVDDVIGITLDTDIVHWAKIQAVIDGDTVTISKAIPAGRTAPVGRTVYTMRWLKMANL